MLRKSLYLIVIILLLFPLKAVDKEVLQPNDPSLCPLSDFGGPEEPDYLPQVAKNPKYQTLFNMAYGFLDFCIDSAENYRASKSYAIENEASIQGNIDASGVLIRFLSHLDQGDITLDQVLQECLRSRLDVLNRRAECYRRTKDYFEKHQKVPGGYFIPSDPKNLRGLSPGDQVLAYETIQRYQFLNLLIYQLYKLNDDPTTLSRKTKEYISCSRTLWPILLGETTDLSFPDFAVITKDEDPEELQSCKDYNYFWSNYDLQPYMLRMMNWCRDLVSVKLSRVEIDEWQKINKENRNFPDSKPLPRPVWLYPEGAKTAIEKEPTRKVIDSQQSFIEGVKRASKKRPHVKKKKEKIYHPSNTPKNLKGVPSTDQESVSSLPGIVEIIEKKIEEPSNPDVEVSKSQVLEPMVELTPIEEIKVYAAPRPRGLRVFHPVLPESSEDTGVKECLLKSRKQTLIDTIFDYHCHGQGFNFGNFRSLWESLCGEGSVRSSGSGSSHYALLNSRGDVVAGTYAHGDGQKYTKRTVRYLRAALNSIGIFQSK